MFRKILTALRRFFRPNVYNVVKVKGPSIHDDVHKQLMNELRGQKVDYFPTPRERAV